MRFQKRKRCTNSPEQQSFRQQQQQQQQLHIFPTNKKSCLDMNISLPYGAVQLIAVFAAQLRCTVCDAMIGGGDLLTHPSDRRDGASRGPANWKRKTDSDFLKFRLLACARREPRNKLQKKRLLHVIFPYLFFIVIISGRRWLTFRASVGKTCPWSIHPTAMSAPTSVPSRENPTPTYPSVRA
uniref:Uncharacterized protein n=1 Tax=Anopheles farauti TaxID=69004 RepID=A0A182QZ96_9DIPT